MGVFTIITNVVFKSREFIVGDWGVMSCLVIVESGVIFSRYTRIDNPKKIRKGFRNLDLNDSSLLFELRKTEHILLMADLPL